jgi:hypothetical protein
VILLKDPSYVSTLVDETQVKCRNVCLKVMFIFQLWKYWDNEIEKTPMPPEYRDFKAEILCKDCHEVGIPQAIRYCYTFSKSAGCHRV